MMCKHCNGIMYDCGLYPIVKCNKCGKIAIDYTEQLYKEMASNGHPAYGVTVPTGTKGSYQPVQPDQQNCANSANINK